MANPTLGANFTGSVIAVPSLTANDFAISESAAGYGILEMKTALLQMTGAVHFDVNNEGDHVLHSATIEQVEGQEYNNGKEERGKLTLVFEPNNDEGATGETARGVTEAMRRQSYDFYVFDNQRRTSAGVHKFVGCTVNLSKVTVTPNEKAIQTLTAETKQEGDYTYNVLKTTYPAA